jgi:hypothetical protein
MSSNVPVSQNDAHPRGLRENPEGGKALNVCRTSNSRNSLKANRVLGDEEPSVTSEANTADDFRANGHGMGIVRQLIYASSGGDADPQSFRVSQRSVLCPILVTR